MGAGGVEPPSSSVSGHARPFARSVAALHGTTSALLRRVTEPSTAVRREAAYGIAADKLLTGGRELHSIWRTSVRVRRPMAKWVAPSDVDQVVLAITLDREEVPVGILEPGDFAAASAG